MPNRILNILTICLFISIFDNLHCNGNEQATDITDVPYLVSILTYHNDVGTFVHTCSGSIIDAKSILTAAHCLYNRDDKPGIFKVRAGSKIGSQERDVFKMIIHSNYQSYTFDNDIALLFLSSPLILNNKDTANVSLPLQGSDFKDNSKAHIAGWGKINTNAESLHVDVVSVMNHTKCAELYSKSTVTENMICAKSSNNVNACQDDSGGPLMINGILYGISSWGKDCKGVNKKPGVWTRVSAFTDWIKFTIDQNSKPTTNILMVLFCVIVSSPILIVRFCNKIDVFNVYY